jgi:hypothetical protein
MRRDSREIRFTTRSKNPGQLALTRGSRPRRHRVGSLGFPARAPAARYLGNLVRTHVFLLVGAECLEAAHHGPVAQRPDAIGAGLDTYAYGTHSMRRTKTAQIYKKTGNLRAVQLLPVHAKLESTVPVRAWCR